MSLVANVEIFVVMGSAFTSSRAVGSRQLDNTQTQTHHSSPDTMHHAVSRNISTTELFTVLSTQSHLQSKTIKSKGSFHFKPLVD